jgi:hypothetical protein
MCLAMRGILGGSDAASSASTLSPQGTLENTPLLGVIQQRDVGGARVGAFTGDRSRTLAIAFVPTATTIWIVGAIPAARPRSRQCRSTDADNAASVARSFHTRSCRACFRRRASLPLGQSSRSLWAAGPRSSGRVLRRPSATPLPPTLTSAWPRSGSSGQPRPRDRARRDPGSALARGQPAGAGPAA